MKAICICIFTLAVLCLQGISQGTMLFLSFEPSSNTHAMGGYNTGVANVWNSDALMCYSNPALASFHSGLSYGMTKYNHQQGSGIDDMYYHAGIALLGYRGMALILPAPNLAGKFSIYLDSGLQTHTDSNGNEVGTSHSWDAARVYGLSVDPIKVYREFSKDHPELLDHFDLAFGASYIDIESYLDSVTGLIDDSAYAKANIWNLGLACKGAYCINDLVNLEASFGLARFNPENKRVSYVDINQIDPIWKSLTIGGGAMISVPLSTLSSIIPENLMVVDNLVSAKYLYGAQSYSLFEVEAETTYGRGLELGLLDMLFFRMGYYDDKAGAISGLCIGAGINLPYKDYGSITFNTSKYEAGDLVDYNRSMDFGINVNFWKFLEK